MQKVVYTWKIKEDFIKKRVHEKAYNKREAS